MSTLADAVSVFRGNPFTDDAVASRARLGRLLLKPPASWAFRGARQGEVPYGLEDLVLAIAHARACALVDPRGVLDEAVVPDTVMAELPRSRLDYTRIALAASRCFRALQGFPGRSPAMARVRRQAWTRALGSSLVEALDTESLRRAQPLVLCGEPGTGRRALALAMLSGLPAPSGRTPWTGPTLAPWTPAGVPSPAGGLVVEGLASRGPEEIRMLRTALGQPGTARLAFVCGPWELVAPVLPPDLVARLAPLRLAIAPLRDRPEDLEAQVLARLVTWGPQLRSSGAPGLDFDRVLRWFSGPEALQHGWPGNQDELETAVRALVLGTSPSLPTAERAETEAPSKDLPAGLAGGTWSDRQVRDWYLKRVHERTGRVGKTASVLGLDRATVRLRLRETGSEVS